MADMTTIVVGAGDNGSNARALEWTQAATLRDVCGGLFEER